MAKELVAVKEPVKITRRQLAENLADAFRKAGQSHVFTYGEVAETLEEVYQEMLENKKARLELKRRDISFYLSHARAYLEVEHGRTIINVLRRGYKLANAQEGSVYGALMVKSAIVRVDRAARIAPIIKAELLPDALKKEINNTVKNLKIFQGNAEPLKLAYHELKRVKP